MTDREACGSARARRIRVVKNGPYSVEGDVPLVSKTEVSSEYGEPLTWQKGADMPVNEAGYKLCRCGKSGHAPFCDGTHAAARFDGTERAPTGPSSERVFVLPGGTHIIVNKDPELCNLSGYCAMRNTTILDLVAKSRDTQVRSLVMAMVERCPSGALTYRIEEGQPHIEPDLPQQIATASEITSNRPIPGPLWVTGSIPLERSDGQPFEARNRVTLCRCGHSSCKPLCDGSHRDKAQRDERRHLRSK